MDASTCWKVRLRLALIAALAVVLLIFQGLSVRQKLWNPCIEGQEGAVLDSSQIRPVVAEVPETRRDGSPNPALLAGVQPGDELLAIENIRGEVYVLKSMRDVGHATRSIHWNEPWFVTVERITNGVPAQLRLAIGPVPKLSLTKSQYLRIAGLIVLLPLMCFAAAILIGFSRPADDNAMRASLMFFGFITLVAVRSDTLPDWAVWPSLFLRIVGPMSAIYFMLSLFFQFPSRSFLDRRLPWLRWTLLAVLTAIAALSFGVEGARLVSFDFAERLLAPAPPAFGAALDTLFGWVVVVAFALGLLALAINTLRNENPAERRRLRLIFVGTLCGVVPLVILIAWRMIGFGDSQWPTILVALTMWLFPALFVYAIVRHQVFGIRLILRRGLQYSLLARGVFVLFVLLAVLLYFLIGPLLAQLAPENGERLAVAGAAGLAVAIALGLREVNRRVMPRIDRAFFRDAYDARVILSDLADAVRQLAGDPERLLRVVSDKLHAALHPRGVMIFLRTEETNWLIPPATLNSGEVTGPQPPACAKEFCCALVSLATRSGDEAGLPQLLRGAALPSSCSLAALLERAQDEAPHAIDILPAVDSPWEKRPVSGAGLRLGQLDEERALLEPVAARLVVPLSTNRRVLGFIVLGEKLSEEPYTREDRELLLAVAGQTATALDYARLIGEMAERERLRSELEIAQSVQTQLFPQHCPGLKTLRYTGVSQAARVLGGDYYDFMLVGPGLLGLALADLSGKGIPAALLMAALQGALRGHATTFGKSISALVAEVNTQLCISTAPHQYATFFYAVYDDERMTLDFVNAGHNPPLVVRSGDTREVLRLTTGGSVIGLLENQAYEQQTIQLRPGDMLVAYSDGVTDAVDGSGEPFGEGRLVDLIARKAHLAPQALQDAILADVGRHAAGVPLEDDVTLIIARVTSEEL